MYKSTELKERNEKIYRLYMDKTKNYSMTKIARMFGISRQRVLFIINKIKERGGELKV